MDGQAPVQNQDLFTGGTDQRTTCRNNSTSQQAPRVREFVLFATLLYSSQWLTCTSATDGPWHDLNLFHKFLMYEAVNPLISRSAVKALKRHMWYLTAEMLPLALFSDIVPTSLQISHSPIPNSFAKKGI